VTLFLAAATDGVARLERPAIVLRLRLHSAGKEP
jgi:hypothetical protein